MTKYNATDSALKQKYNISILNINTYEFIKIFKNPVDNVFFLEIITTHLVVIRT
jgi:hypothetical protein